MNHAINSVKRASACVGIVEISAHLRNVEMTVTALHHGDLLTAGD
jgi:hypothetical protein